MRETERLVAALKEAVAREDAPGVVQGDPEVEDALKAFIREYIQEESSTRQPWLQEAVRRVQKPTRSIT